ncbi:hypothetical protein SAMN05216219_1747 [Mycetocola miduiensis]|uniref:Amino acid permease n=1 Tax=Mycetocola miduiensis TaxID=995034 RepID=A0A1I5B5K7_9MICO|nr:hypothetical protein SAMN05216219_1747 [Mycetocola miduiensis]
MAYAPQELLMILMLGGLAFLSFAPWVAACVVVLLVVVVASYRQLIKAYPSGGGDYEVAHRNLGEKAGLARNTGRPSSPSTCPSTSSVTGGSHCFTTVVPSGYATSSCSCTAWPSPSCHGSSTRPS